MRMIFIMILLGFLLFGCATLSYQDVIKTGVAGTQTILTSPTISVTAAISPTQTDFPITPLPTLTSTVPIPTDTLLPQDPITTTGQIGQPITCGDSLIATVPDAPEFIKDLFEHHAIGTFLIVKLRLVNSTDQPIQIWDGDYRIEGEIEGKIKAVPPHRAATTYLFIQRGGMLMQDKIEPGVMNWETILAFDVDPEWKNWIFVVKPGFEGGQALCELRFSLVSPE